MIPTETIVGVVVGALFVGFWITSFTILYHLIRFGIGVLPKKLAVLFLVGAISLFTWSIILFARLDLNNISL
ncbi:MAG: hypothetical protein AAB780_01970 [Patescibacteria group bacterium]